MSTATFESCVRQSEFSPARLMEREFCSPWWVAASHVRRRDGLGRMLVCRRRDAYPVAGMVKCPICGRFAPSDSRYSLCVDCGVEVENQARVDRIKRWPLADRVEFLRLWWQRPVRAGQWAMEGMPLPEADAEDGLSIPEEPDGDDTVFNEADLFNGTLERDQTWGHAASLKTTLAMLRGRFLQPGVPPGASEGTRLKRHGAGCHVNMLSESEEALRKEIAYYHAKGRIAPSTRRINNPFDRSERPLPMPGKLYRLYIGETENAD